MFIAFFYFTCVTMMVFNVCVNDTVQLLYTRSSTSDELWLLM